MRTMMHTMKTEFDRGFAPRPAAGRVRVMVLAAAVALAGAVPGGVAAQDRAPAPAPAGPPDGLDWTTVQDSTHILFSIEGLEGPEAVRYDPDQDVWFVGNWAGGGNERNAAGYISRVGADGTMETRRFMVGTAAAPLHAPRGMYIVGDTLWVADVDGVHGFHRGTGAHLAFADLTHLEPGFLNDVAADAGGVPYVTDSSNPRFYRVTTAADGSRSGEVAIESERLDLANGVTWDAANGRFVFAPWRQGATTFVGWRPGEAEVHEVAASPDGGRFDGLEFVGGAGILAASQADRSLHLVEPGTRTGRPVVMTVGNPADIGVDTRRFRVAVPYIALNRVDVWQLPSW
jgi:hypothetical protein